MNNKVTCLFAFSLGAAVGTAVSWKILKTKYEQIAREEIASVKEVFSTKEPSVKKEHVTVEKPDIFEYAAKIAEVGYKKDSIKEEQGDEPASKPYVITPEEFGEVAEYETNSLTYYSDGILADDADEVVDDVEHLIGKDSLNHFGEYEDDSVFVRNDDLQCDYEILLDMRKYSEVKGTAPHTEAEE